MPRKNVEEARLLAAVYLFSQRYSRKNIVDMLGVSQATVSRRIKQAQEDGLLEVRYQFVEEKISKELMREIKSLISPQPEIQKVLDRISEEYGKAISPQVHVFPNPDPTLRSEDLQDDDAWHKHIAWFGQAVAEPMRTLLKQSSLCGVSWGQTVSRVAEGLHTPGVTRARAEKTVRFIPVCGEPLETTIMQFSSSHIAARLEEIINDQSYHSLSLAVVPASIPFDSQENLEVIQNYLKTNVKAYQRIFIVGDENENGNYEPLVEHLDTILTSVGSAGGSARFFGDAVTRTGNINSKKLNELAIGDISGVIFPRTGCEAAPELQRYQKCWTGITKNHIVACAKRAAEQHKPGVIVVAAGVPEKAASIRECVRSGLVNHLFIDTIVAEALLIG